MGDARTIGLSTAAAITAYGSANLSAAQAGDILIATVKEGNLEASELAGALGQALPISAALGVSFAELGASVAHYTRLGVSAGQATTGVRAAMTSFLNPAAKSLKLLNELGISADDLKAMVAEKGLGGALDHLRTQLGDDVAFSKFLGSSEALSFALAVTGDNAEGFAETLDGVSDSAGAVGEAFKQTQETTDFQIKKMKASINVLMTELGTYLLPVVQDTIDLSLDLFDALGLVKQGFEEAAEASGVTEEEFAILAEQVGGKRGFLGKIQDVVLAIQNYGFAVTGLSPQMRTYKEDLADQVEVLIRARSATLGVTDQMDLMRMGLGWFDDALATTEGVAKDVKDAIDDVADSVASANYTASLFDTTKMRSELLAAAVAAQVNQAALRGDDPFIAAQEAFDALIANQAKLSGLTSAQDVLGIFGGAGSIRGDAPIRESASVGGRERRAIEDGAASIGDGAASIGDESGLDIEPYNIALNNALAEGVRMELSPDQLAQLEDAFDTDYFLTEFERSEFRTQTGFNSRVDELLSTIEAGRREALEASQGDAKLAKELLEQQERVADGIETYTIELNRTLGRGVAMKLDAHQLMQLEAAFNTDDALTRIQQSEFHAETGFLSHVDRLLSQIRDARQAAKERLEAADSGSTASETGRRLPAAFGGQSTVGVGSGARRTVGVGSSSGGNGATYYVTINVEAQGGDPEVIADAIFPALQQLESRGSMRKVTL